MLKKVTYLSNKELFLQGFFMFFILGTSLSTILRFYRQDYIIVFFDLLALCFISWIIYDYHQRKKYKITVLRLFWLSSITIFIYIIHLNYSLHIFLVLLIPLAASMLLEDSDFKRHGALFLLIFFLIMLYGFSHKERYPYLNDSNFLIGFVLLFFFHIGFSLVYHKSIKQSYTRLEQADNEKAFLLKEVHHRVKNNLNMMTSILGLQEENAKNEDIRTFIEQNILRIKSIALVHELLYKEQNFKTINLHDYIHNLSTHIVSISKNKNIQIHLDIEDVTLNTNDSIHIGIIVNELMTNSIKYAFNFQENGKIFISLAHKDTQHQFYYQDNGKGMNIHGIEDYGFGLSLVSLSVEHLQGSMKILSKSGLHTEITFKGTPS